MASFDDALGVVDDSARDGHAQLSGHSGVDDETEPGGVLHRHGRRRCTVQQPGDLAAQLAVEPGGVGLQDEDRRGGDAGGGHDREPGRCDGGLDLRQGPHRARRVGEEDDVDAGRHRKAVDRPLGGVGTVERLDVGDEAEGTGGVDGGLAAGPRCRVVGGIQHTDQIGPGQQAAGQVEQAIGRDAKRHTGQVVLGTALVVDQPGGGRVVGDEQDVSVGSRVGGDPGAGRGKGEGGRGPAHCAARAAASPGSGCRAGELVARMMGTVHRVVPNPFHPPGR